MTSRTSILAPFVGQEWHQRLPFAKGKTF